MHKFLLALPRNQTSMSLWTLEAAFLPFFQSIMAVWAPYRRVAIYCCTLLFHITCPQLILLVCAITLGVAAVALFIYSFFEEEYPEYQQMDSEFPSSEHIWRRLYDDFRHCNVLLFKLGGPHSFSRWNAVQAGLGRWFRRYYLFFSLPQLQDTCVSMMVQLRLFENEPGSFSALHMRK